MHRDMVFYLTPDYLGVEPVRGNGTVRAFRHDCEQKDERPDRSIDLSSLFHYHVDDKQSILDCAKEFLRKINEYETIHTDRLHVAIGGMLLGKRVFLYPNNYYKNRAVYEFSLNETGVQFRESVAPFHS